MTRTITQIDMTQLVYSDDQSSQIIGIDSPDKGLVFKPWVWDERIWGDERYENTDLAIPTLGDAQTSGIPLDLWQSGVGSLRLDLEVDSPVILRKESQDYWTFKIRHGEYFKYSQKNFLFADGSINQLVDSSDNESDRNVLELSYIPKNGSQIIAKTWKRDLLGDLLVYRNIHKRMTFTGQYADEEQLETEDENGDIVWANVDTTKHEFVVKWTTPTTPPTLYFNKDFTFLVGIAVLAEDDDLEYCDALGESSGEEDQVLSTHYFPIEEGSFTLYQDTYTNILVDGVDYEVDLDRGEVTFLGAAPAAGSKLYAKYTATVQVEYEPVACDLFRTAATIDVNPLRTSINKGFIYITEEDLRVAYITLTSSALLIEEGLYGPISLGSGYCYLIATAYSKNGQVVPGVEISFYLDEAEEDGYNGRINGSGAAVEMITDANGQARVVYSAPRSIESIGQYVTHPAGDNADELTLVDDNGLNSDTLTDLYVYQVYFDDPMLPWAATPTEDEPGTGGRKVILYKWTKESELGGGDAGVRNWLTTANGKIYKHPRTGETGAYMPIQPTGISSNVLSFADSLPLTEDPAETWTLGESYILDDIIWHPATDSFYKCILGHTATLSEEPPNATYWTVDTNAGNLVAYWITGGKSVKVYASCYSTLLNRTIYADPISLTINVPEYMSGVYVMAAPSDDVIPYGFRLYDSHGSAASALDGTTFLSIHPSVGFWPVVWEGIQTGEIENTSPETPETVGCEVTVTIS